MWFVTSRTVSAIARSPAEQRKQFGHRRTTDVTQQAIGFAAREG